MPGWLAVPRDWLASLGEIARFCGRTMGLVYSGRVLQFFGEALRQAGILILGSTIVIWGLVFILGLQCGIEGAYFTRSVGAPAYAGNFAAWMTLPFMYLAAIGVGFVASYIAVVEQIGDTSSGGYLLIFWMFQNPPDLIFSVIKGMFMATAIVLVGCYYGYTASGGPVGVGTATAKSMVLNIVLVHIIGMMGTLVFWGANPRAPIGG
jgi:phospholipid/cholesterol/gamma-HCH transport system permease protein